MVFGTVLLRSAIAAYNSLLFASWDTDYGTEKRWLALFFDEGQAIYVPVLAQSFFVTTPGSNFTITSDATWNNANNSVECIGAGGSGAAQHNGTHACGSGGGAYSAITNFSFAVPGTTTATARIGAGGAGLPFGDTNGKAGGSTWFNNATDPGNGADNSKCSAAGGVGGTRGAGSQTGGAGGATTASWGQTKFAGGRGGNLSGASGRGASGGGGAAGPNGAGANGVDSSATTSTVATNGGAGDNNSGGAGGTGTTATPGGAGSAGTESDATHGSGGGGGGVNVASGDCVSGAGGNYGAASGGSVTGGSSDSPSTPAGKSGLIVLTWTPSTSIVPFLRPHNPNTMRHLRR